MLRKSSALCATIEHGWLSTTHHYMDRTIAMNLICNVERPAPAVCNGELDMLVFRMGEHFGSRQWP